MTEFLAANMIDEDVEKMVPAMKIMADAIGTPESGDEKVRHLEESAA